MKNDNVFIEILLERIFMLLKGDIFVCFMFYWFIILKIFCGKFLGVSWGGGWVGWFNLGVFNRNLL